MSICEDELSGIDLIRKLKDSPNRDLTDDFPD